MSYYPILVDLKGRKVLVVGGGSVAQRKIDTLLECSAQVILVSVDLNPTLQEYVDTGKIEYLSREFNEVHMDKVFMVIAATDDSELNHRISSAAEEKNILVNAVDQPEDCNFIVPSIVKRGDFLIAISTSGKSPAFAKKIRKKLSDQFGIEYEYFLRMMGRIRKEVLSLGYSQDKNSRIFNELVHSSIFEAIKKEDWQEVSLILSGILNRRITESDVNNYIKD
jgi:precorrin-2 dehydrogenase/sirohydrochlorin ferrochelatase